MERSDNSANKLDDNHSSMKEQYNRVIDRLNSSEVSMEGVRLVLRDFVIEIINAEEDNLYYEADNGWADLNILLDIIKEKLSIIDLVSLAKIFVGDKSGYFVAAGLTMLALPKVVNYFKENHMQNELADVFQKYIPSEEEISSMDSRSADMYGFYMATEGLLGTDFNGQWKDRLSEKHNAILKECCEAPDMQGTLIYQIYGAPEIK